MIKKILKYIINIYYKYILKKKNIFISRNVNIRNASFSIYNSIGANCQITGSSFGKCTYLGPDCILRNVQIGSFCSIGPKTEVIYGTHPIDFVSTHPSFYSTRKQCGMSFTNQDYFQEFKFVGNIDKSVLIENDVWIGYGVRIIEGVTIGNGAIVLAGALVTKDVKPYSIVGGVPAKHIKYRFSLQIRTKLQKSQWWEKDLLWLQNNVKKFYDIDSFLNIDKDYKF